VTADVETVVVGAGVVGLAVARALAAAGHGLMVLERHAEIGRETSSRSSEVIHAGLYYPAGSLRARLCVEGRDLLYAFALENGVAHVRYGKLVVATSADDLPRLDTLARTAAGNGVLDIVRLSAADVRVREPELTAAGALLSPSTGAIDSHGLMVALEGHLRTSGGAVVLETEVTGLAVTPGGGFSIACVSGGERSTLTARNLVLAGGLGATRLGRMLAARPGYEAPATYPARGHYFSLAGKAPFRHLVYPLPSRDALGIHLTLDVAGAARFGPDLEWQDGEPSYAFDEGGGARRARFAAEIRRYWPGLDQERLEPAYVGVRPKIYRSGESPADFAIHGRREHGIDRLVALYGIESPGLTSSLAIGNYVARLLA
jgi:L-2-hydroxyglutarate oxidase LhgO